MLTHLVTVADIAARHALALMPTLFTGHMSGVNWIPPWALTRKKEVARFRVVSGEQGVRARLKNGIAMSRSSGRRHCWHAKLLRPCAIIRRYGRTIWVTKTLTA